MKGVRARCPVGGIAPCADDLCNGTSQTICGLEEDIDFCEHGFIPETCPDCEGEDDYYDFDEEFPF